MKKISYRNHKFTFNDWMRFYTYHHKHKYIKEHILKDNVAYDSFSSYSDSDTIIRLPNGEYIHGTKEVNGKYYDSDQDSGAIQAKKAKY